MTKNHIICGEYYFQGNLVDYMQNVTIKVLPAEKTLKKQLDPKLCISFCLRQTYGTGERDHASIRLNSVQQIIAFHTSLLLAIREYTRQTPAKTTYVYKKLIDRTSEVWQGQYDGLIRK